MNVPKEVLGLTVTPTDQTLKDTVDSLLELGQLYT